MTRTALGNSLERVLRDRNLSRLDLAALCELSYSTVRKMVSKRLDPLLIHAIAVADALDEEVENLFFLPAPLPQSREAEQ